MTHHVRFNGVWVPLITPIKNKNIDLDGLSKLVEWVLTYPVQGVIVGGCCAERLLLSDGEIDSMVNVTLSVVGQRCKIVTAMGSQSTEKTVESIRFHAQRPVDGLMVSVPTLYTQPTQSSLLPHFMALSETSPLPLIIDNDPHRRGFGLDSALLKSLYTSLKESLGEHNSLRAVRHSLRPGEDWASVLADSPLNVLCGDDTQLHAFLKEGGKAVACAVAQLAPGLMCRMLSPTALLSKYDDVFLQRCLNMLGGASTIAALKYHLSELGLVRNELRTPLEALSYDEAWTSNIEGPTRIQRGGT